MKKIIIFVGISRTKIWYFCKFIEQNPHLECLCFDTMEDAIMNLKPSTLSRVILLVFNFHFVDVSGEVGKIKDPHKPNEILKMFGEKIPALKAIKKIILTETEKDIILIDTLGGVQDPTVVKIISMAITNPEFFYNEEVTQAIA